MTNTLAEAKDMVNRMSRELMYRRGDIEMSRDYYEGKHPLVYASEQYRNYFADRYAGFSDNWTGVVADSPAERLDPIGIRLGGEQSAGDLDLWKVWLRNGADADVSMAFLDAGISRRAFGFVWGNDEDEGTPEVCFESATEAIVAYKPGSRRQRVAGMKLWRDETAEYATLYTPDEVWRFRRRSGVPAMTPNGIIVIGGGATEDWQFRDEDHMEPEPNKLGVVPLVELPNRPLLSRQPLSDVNGVIAMQDAINLLWSQMFTASDFSSFKQRVILGADMPKIPILNDQGQKVGEKPIDLQKFAVDRVIWLEKPEAKIAEWSADDLTTWTSVIEVAVGHIAAQTRTPQHYLIGKMANLSGDALIAAETGLVKRTQEKQLYYGEAIREMFRLICLARGEKEKASDVQWGAVQWKDAQFRSEAQHTDALLKKKQIGYPFEWIAEQDGLSPTEIDRVMKMREADMERVMLDPTLDTGAKGGGFDGGAGYPEAGVAAVPSPAADGQVDG